MLATKLATLFASHILSSRLQLVAAAMVHFSSSSLSSR